MFIITLTYKKSIEEVEKYIIDHKLFLDEAYKNNYFIASGPKNPRTGGVIISQLKNRSQLENIIKHDPFYIHKIADYDITEFNPTKYHANFAAFIKQD